MSEPKLISPMLDGFAMGEPFSDHNGVRCCPAMDQQDGNKYIVKIISSPASSTQLDAMLLSGAFPDKASAVAYFKEIADGIVAEAEILKKLADLEGFISFSDFQLVPHDEEDGFDLYLLSPYMHSLDRTFRKHSMTHLSAVNLGLDLCAALSVCRRSGYLFVNLTPENIYPSDNKGYKIGDLGFISLNSLKYASLPDRYRSAYTAPEIEDAFSSLNTTVDVYAVGLILYQAFNGGVLPKINPDEPLPPPDFADYEMAEIIMKACATAPEDRWKDPLEMGQALVTYMQRNGAHDTPIIPAPTQNIEPEVQPADSNEQLSMAVEELPSAEEVEMATDASAENSEPCEDVDTSAEEEIPVEESIETTDEEKDQDAVFTEDALGNLTFLDDSTESDETLPGFDAEDLDYDQVSVELSDILNQADAILAHPTPDPVVTPDPEEFTIPETANNDAEETDIEVPTDTNESSEDENLPAEDEGEQLSYDPETAGIDSDNEDEYWEETPRKKNRWVPIVVVIAILAALAAGAFYYYQNFYLQMIDSIVLDGEKTQLTVQLHTEIDETLLTVVCSDAYGNQLQQPVVGGKAVFNDLSPDAAYTVKVLIKGFHRLTGKTSGAYTTPVQTNITDLTAKTGQTDGNVLLTFGVDGPDATEWKVTYSTEGEEPKEVIFSDHQIELPGLTVGKNYTFEVAPTENLFFVGENTVTYTASKLIVADSFTATQLSDGKLTVAWSVPDGSVTTNWTVHCYNASGYDKVLTTQESTATFTDLTVTDAFSVELVADGMTQFSKLEIPANSICVTEFKNTSTSKNKISLSWKVTETDKDKKFVLEYSIDGSAVKELKDFTENTAVFNNAIPGATYSFVLKTETGNTVIGGTLTHKVPDAADFDDFGIKKKDVVLTMCRTPANANWKHTSVPKSNYTTTFTVGQKASFIIKLNDTYSTSTDQVTTLYVIKDSEGKFVSSATQTASWQSMWYQRYGEFDVPALPGTAGQYTIYLYFNGGFVGSQDFTMK